jgi:hypothetical protein
MVKFNEKFHQLHYSSLDKHSIIQELRKMLGDASNGYISVHKETTEAWKKQKSMSDQELKRIENIDKQTDLAVFKKVSSLIDALNHYEKYPGSIKHGLQLELNLSNKRLESSYDDSQRLLNSSIEEIKPHISGRAARKQAR